MSLDSILAAAQAHVASLLAYRGGTLPAAPPVSATTSAAILAEAQAHAADLQAFAAAAVPVNVALAANGGVASASSQYSANFPVASINNGDRKGTAWGAGGGWNDATQGAFPDWVQITFSGQKPISSIVLYTLQDNFQSAVEPSDTLTFNNYGVTSFDVLGWNGSAWVTLASVTGNRLVKRTVPFASFSTDRIRINLLAGVGGYARIVELEAWTGTPTAPPTQQPQPQITSLTATPASLPIGGGQVKIDAPVLNATDVFLNGAKVTLPWTGTITQTTLYTLVANGAAGTTPASASVNVIVAVSTAGFLPSRGSTRYDNNLLDMIDMSKVMAPMPWPLFRDTDFTIAPHMHGVEPGPTQYKRLHVYGPPAGYSNRTVAEVNGQLVQVEPDLGYDGAGILRLLKDYPLRDGPRGRHILSSATTWRWHTRIKADGTMTTKGLAVPFFVGVVADGTVMAAMRDGGIKTKFKVALKSYCFDFCFHLPVTDGFDWYVDSGVGELLNVDRKTGVKTIHCSGMDAAGPNNTRIASLPSVQEVNGIPYTADQKNGCIWKIDPVAPETKTKLCDLPGAFFVRTLSDGRLICATDSLAIWIINLNGSLGPQLMPKSQRRGPGNAFQGLSVDINGTMGTQDAVVCFTTLGPANTDLWRLLPPSGGWPLTATATQNDAGIGILQPRSGGSSIQGGNGVVTVGMLQYVKDPIGHYPWFFEVHGEEGAAMTGGMADIYPQIIVTTVGDTWVPFPYNTLYAQLNRGWILTNGNLDTFPIQQSEDIPSWTTEVNQTGGGQLWSFDHFAEMTFPDQVKFIRAGGIGSWPRDRMSATDLKALQIYWCFNSIRYLREGKPFIDALLAWQNATDLSPAPLPPVVLPAWGNGKPLNEWFEIPGTAMAGSATDPGGDPANEFGPWNYRIAFSGMALRKAEVILAASGGHGDWSGNGVYSIDLAADAPKWVVRKTDSAVADRTQNVAYYADGTPSSRHTYYSSHFSKIANRVMNFGSRAVYGGGVDFPHTNGFNLDTNAWDKAGTWAAGGMTGACVDAAGQAWFPGFIKWSPYTGAVTDRYTQMYVNGPRLPLPFAYDRKRNQLFSMGFGDGLIWTGATFAAYKVNIDGAPTAITFNPSAAYTQFLASKPELCAMDYDPDNDRFLWYDGRPADAAQPRPGQEGVIFVITPNATAVWDMSILALGPGSIKPAGSAGGGVCSRFRYVPAFKGFVLLARGTKNVYFIRTAN